MASVEPESSEYVQIDEYNCCLEAFESGEPNWSRPYVDSEYSDESVVTCYLRMGDLPVMIYADVELNLLLHTIDSLQFYQDSRMYVTVPDGPTYTVEDADGSFVLYSDGDDFDPTQYVAPQATGDLPIGGRGIMLMRQCCTDISYRRNDDGINILTLKM